jgi:hypothetical protein
MLVKHCLTIKQQERALFEKRLGHCQLPCQGHASLLAAGAPNLHSSCREANTPRVDYSLLGYQSLMLWHMAAQATDTAALD